MRPNSFDNDKLYLNMVKNKSSQSNSFEPHSKSVGREKKSFELAEGMAISSM